MFASLLGIGLQPVVFPQESKDCVGKESPKIKTVRSFENFQNAFNSGGSRGSWVSGDVEKSIKTNEKVYLSFCATEISVKVNGWNRSEIRAFVKGRGEIAFDVRDRNKISGLPQWVELLAKETEESTRTLDSCISGEMLELDVPYLTSVTISGKSGNTSVSIDSVRTAKIDISGGDISLMNISNGVEAHTDLGGVSVRNSDGRMKMTTTAGNIVAFETDSDEIGDYFKAKTISGAITLQSVKQKEVEATSLSGSISFLGIPYSAGNYSFSTTNGLISVAVPYDAAFKLKAAYGGSFSSELPLENIYKKAASSTVFLTGFVGNESGASLSLSSYSGTIRILKLGNPLTP